MIIQKDEIDLRWIRSERESEKIMGGKRGYGGTVYNNCSQILREFYEILYSRKTPVYRNTIFVDLDKSFAILDKGELNFSGVLNKPSEVSRKGCEIFFREEDNSNHSCLVQLCESYKSSFARRTKNKTCPVKWFYERYFNFNNSCVVDRALNGETIRENELKVFHDLPIFLTSARPLCPFFRPSYEDEEDFKEHMFQMRNYEYLIEMGGLEEQKRDIFLFGF